MTGTSIGLERKRAEIFSASTRDIGCMIISELISMLILSGFELLIIVELNLALKYAVD